MRESYVVLWQRAARLVVRRLQEIYEPMGVDVRHLWILLSLQNCPGSSQGAVAAKLGIHENTMVKIVDDMETKELVRRRRDPKNRRELRLDVLPKGTELLSWLDQRFEATALEAYRPLTIKELDLIKTLSKRIIASVE